MQVTFQIPNVQVGAASTTFNGHYEPPKDEYDCVAVFDGTGFILERTGGQVKNLRCESAHGACPPLQQ